MKGLNIAIDHRISALFKPVPRRPFSRKGTHITILRECGLLLEREDAEIRVTSDLAGPGSTGGIAVSLQQPRSNHPFDEGTEAVIEDSNTLRALEELFYIVSCGTLDIRKDVSIIDVLPYITDEEMESADEKQLKNAFDAFLHAVGAKKPNVLLAMGKVRLPWGMDDCKGKAWKLENRSVGEVFNPSRVWISGVEGRFVPVERVNCSHPSHSLRYGIEHSVLRQLLFLETAHACAVSRGDWEEGPQEGWMTALRENCTYVARELMDHRPKYLPDYSDLYCDRLQWINDAALELFSSHRSVEIGMLGPEQVYESVRDSCLSRLCNDASLIMAKIAELETKGWPEYYDERNNTALETVIYATHSLCEGQDWDGIVRLGDESVGSIILRGIESLMECFRRISRNQVMLDYRKTGKAFLQMALNLETMMGNFYAKGRYAEEPVIFAREVISIV